MHLIKTQTSKFYSPVLRSFLSLRKFTCHDEFKQICMQSECVVVTLTPFFH